MTDLIIPAKYPGIEPYQLVFHGKGADMRVRRSWEPSHWVDVHDVRVSPIDKDPDVVALEINADMKHGAPLYAHVSRDDAETVRRLKG